MQHQQSFNKGHPLYPDGAVVVMTLNEAGQTVSTETYTIEQWQEQQQSQQS